MVVKIGIESNLFFCFSIVCQNSAALCNNFDFSIKLTEY